MSANMALVKERGISEMNVALINLIHEQLDEMLDSVHSNTDKERELSMVTELEFTLQELWGFPQDSRYHTWTERLLNRFREVEYVGSTYRCTETGEEATVTLEALQAGHLSVGKGFIDFGGVVRRVGPIEKVK